MTDWIEQLGNIVGEHDRDQLLTKYEVADLLRVAPTTVTKMGRSGVLPRVVLNARTIRFRMDEVRRYIREQQDEG